MLKWIIYYREDGKEIDISNINYKFWFGFYDVACSREIEIIETVIKAAKVLSEVRLIGWDIALTDEGPLILEANRKSDFYLSQSQGQVFFDSAYVHENMIK